MLFNPKKKTTSKSFLFSLSVFPTSTQLRAQEAELEKVETRLQQERDELASLEQLLENPDATLADIKRDMDAARRRRQDQQDQRQMAFRDSKRIQDEIGSLKQQLSEQGRKLDSKIGSVCLMSTVDVGSSTM